MRPAILALSLLLLVAGATAVEFGPLSYLRLPSLEGILPDELPLSSLDEYCLEVGFRSGCSGCNQDTYGLCSFLMYERNVDKSFCISKSASKKWIQAAEDNGVPVVNAQDAEICPENPVEEASLRPADDTFVSKVLTGLVSHSYEPQYCEFPEGVRTVDRFIYSSLQDDLNNKGVGDVCNQINSRRLTERGLGALGPCPLQEEEDRACLSLWADFFCTSRCPQYGTSINSFCKSSYDRLAQACEGSTVPGRCVPPVTDLLPYVIDSSGSTFVSGQCTDMFATKHSHEFDFDYKILEPVACAPQDCRIIEIFDTQYGSFDDSFEDGCIYDSCNTPGHLYLQPDVAVVRESCGGVSCAEIIAVEYEIDPSKVSCDLGRCTVVDSDNCPSVAPFSESYYTMIHVDDLFEKPDERITFDLTVPAEGDAILSFTVRWRTEGEYDGIGFSVDGDEISTDLEDYFDNLARIYEVDSESEDIYYSEIIPEDDWDSYTDVVFQEDTFTMNFAGDYEPGTYTIALGFATDGSCSTNNCEEGEYSPAYFGIRDIRVNGNLVSLNVGERYSFSSCPFPYVRFHDLD